MRKFTVFALAGLVAALVAGAPKSASARVDLCQAGISKETQKLRKALIQRITKCGDFIRKERDFQGPKGKGNLPKAAGLCGKQLILATDVLEGNGGKDAITKFLAKMDSLRPAKCADGEIDLVGFLESGKNAPPFSGGNEIDWAKYKIATREIAEAFAGAVDASPDTDSLFQELILTKVDPKTSDPFPIVDCVSTSSPDVYPELEGAPLSAVGLTPQPGHADLCAWSKSNSNDRNQFWVGTGTYRNLCFQHACKLACQPDPPFITASFAAVRLALPTSEAGPTGTGGTNVAFPPICGTTITTGCRTDTAPRLRDILFGGTAGSNARDIRLSGAAPGKTLLKIDLLSLGFVCALTLETDGWCDCDGAQKNYPINVVSCADHSVGWCDGSNGCKGNQTPSPGSACTRDSDCGGDTCPVTSPLPANEEDCFCSVSTPPCGGLSQPECVADLLRPCQTHAQCSAGGGSCIARDTGGKCHLNTRNSRGESAYIGASVDGECLQQASTALTVVGNTGGEGICVGGGTNEGEECVTGTDCPGGGASCLAFRGLDGILCTQDDITVRATAGYSISTNGTMLAIARDALFVEGACSVGGEPCYEDENCDGFIQGGGGETCNGTSIANIEAPVLIGGSGISCGQRETSDLAGNVTAAAFPFIDSSLGDGTSSTFLICQ